jgi:hypothetical protein
MIIFLFHLQAVPLEDALIKARAEQLLQVVFVPKHVRPAKPKKVEVSADGTTVSVDFGTFTFQIAKNGRVLDFSNWWAGGEMMRYYAPYQVSSEQKISSSIKRFLEASGNGDLELKVREADKGLELGPNGGLPSEKWMEFDVCLNGVNIFRWDVRLRVNRLDGQIEQFSLSNAQLPLSPRSFKPEVGPQTAEATALARHAKWFPDSSPNEISTDLVILPVADRPMESSERWFESYLTERRKKDFEEGRGVLAWVSFIGGERGPFVRCTTDAITGQVLWVAGHDGSGGFGGGGKRTAPPISYGEGTWSVTVSGKTKKVWADLQPVRFFPAKKNSPSMLLRRGKLLFRLNPTAKPNIYTDTASKLSYRLSGPKSTG